MGRYRFSILAVLLCLFGRGYSQVIQAPDLQCVVDSTNGNITLYWSNPATNPCGAFVQYTIYASSTGANGPYNPVAVTNQAAVSFVLTNYLSQSTQWYFYMQSDYNCPGATVLQSDTVSNQPPGIPTIINVTVQNGRAVINWQEDPSPQTYFYIVYYYEGNGNARHIDTIYGRENTTFTDVNPAAGENPNVNSVMYTVSAQDSCGQASAFTVDQNTIYLSAGITECQRQINMSWNAYNNWPQGVAAYQVWVSRNDSPFVLSGTNPGSLRTFGYTNFNDGDSICMFVTAISAADSSVISNSNVVCMKANIVQPPSFIYITNVTVDSANQILVTWNVDTTGQLLYYEIQQSNNGTYYVIESQFNCPSPLPAFETFLDTVSSATENPNWYQVIAVDSCQNQYPSQIAETVNLMGALADYYVASLTWNAFSLPGATVLYYNLYRAFGPDTTYQLIKTFNNNTFADIDSLQNFLDQKGTFCYRIEAVYYLSLPNGFSDTLTSWSNNVCIIHQPVIYIPNVFAPNGNVEENTKFYPTIIYGNPQDYSMTIYNRWGGAVYTTNDPSPSAGWNGTENGKDSPQGGYAYVIKFTADDGVVVQQQGVFLLLR